MSIRGGRVVDLDKGRWGPSKPSSIDEPTLPFGSIRHRQYDNISDRLYALVLALRRAGHRVYQQGSRVLIDDRAVAWKGLAIVAAHLRGGEPCKKV